MAKDKKLVEAITSMEEDFAQWYTDVVRKAELIDYSSVKGCMILRPAGYAIWENIQHELDRRFKETGVENVYLPLFIPESLLEKEKDHVEGFAPEVAWVTYGGLNQLPERLCVRPTSETLFCDFYKNIIQSYRDLPKVYNQWCSVVRWEKETRPFLRSREFLWQEGHTAHATAEEAEQRTIQMLNVYADFCEEVLAMPVVRGQKTEKEKFAGAEATYTIEALMHDGKALQSGTSHNFGNGFAKAFGIQYTDKDNKLQYVYQTSWGMTTRLIGAIIMVHGDDVAVRRDTREKIEIALDELEAKLPELLEQIQKDMFARAKAHRDAHIWDAHNYEEFTTIANEKPGFIRAMWCGDQACEDKIKEDLAVTSRCMPFNDQEQRLLILSRRLCMMARLSSQVQAITLVMDLPKHLVSSTQTRIIS